MGSKAHEMEMSTPPTLHALEYYGTFTFIVIIQKTDIWTPCD